VADDPDTTDPVASLPAALAYSLAGNQGVKNSALADKYLTERRGRSAKYAADYEDVMSQRQAEVENAKRILDQAAEAMRAGHTGAGPWQMNLPMLQMAAGFFKPTKTGNFGEELGNALTGLGAGVAHQRMSNTEFEKGMADLQMKKSTLAQEPLKDRAAMLKAQQLAEEQGVRAIEVAQFRTPSGGNEPAELKVYNAARASSPDPNKFTDFDTWRSLSAGKKEYAKVSGREAAEAAASLPQLEAQAQSFRQQIDKILDPTNRQHLLALIGVVDGRMPEALITNPKTQDMLAALKTLEAMTFGEAVAKMKGLGGLSNAEGQKIQDILGKLNRKGTPQEFIDVLTKMRDSTSVISSEVAKKKSEWSGSPPAASQPPAPGPAAPVDYQKLYGVRPRG
jgi:hypothetical protein